MREVVSAKEAPRSVGNKRILLSVFHSSGKVFFRNRNLLREHFQSPNKQFQLALKEPNDNLMTPSQ